MNRLYEWQEQHIRKARSHTSLACFAGMQSGKTVTHVVILRQIIDTEKEEEDNAEKTIIVCPIETQLQWEKDLLSNLAAEKDLYSEDKLIDYYLRTPYVAKEKICRRHAYKNEQDFLKAVESGEYTTIILSPSTLSNMKIVHALRRFEAHNLIFDESHQGKNCKSNTWLSLCYIRWGNVRLHTTRKNAEMFPVGKATIKHCYCLSGTPASNTMEDLWGQLYLLDYGKRLGQTKYVFLATYASSIAMTGAGGQRFNKYSFSKSQCTRIMERISDISTSLDSELVLQTVLIEETIKVEMTDEQRKTYDKFHETAILEYRQERDKKTYIAANAISIYTKLHSIASGFFIFPKNEKNEQEVVRFKGNQKIRALLGILKKHSNEQIIIWCAYVEEYKMLKILFNHYELQDAVVYVTGQITATQKKKNIEDFKKGEKQILVAHRASCGTGVVFSNAHVIINYGQTCNMALGNQANYRNRAGTGDRYIYTIITNNSIDELFVKNINRKVTINKAVLEYFQAVTGV